MERLTGYNQQGERVGEPITVRPGAVLIQDTPDGPAIWWPRNGKQMVWSGVTMNVVPLTDLFGPGVVEIRVEEI